MSELYWPRRAVFTDYSEATATDYSEGVHDVPEEKVDQYLERGWRKPENSDAASDASASSDDADDTTAGDQELDDDELALDTEAVNASAEDDTPDPAPEGAIDADESPDADEASESFDPEAFVDRNVGPVKEDIYSGEYDDHLAEIERAETENRGRVTVGDAIDERRDSLE